MHILSMMTQFQTFIEIYFVGNYTYGGVYTVNYTYGGVYTVNYTYGGVYTVNKTDAHGIQLKYTEALFFCCYIQKCELA